MRVRALMLAWLCVALSIARPTPEMESASFLAINQVDELDVEESGNYTGVPGFVALNETQAVTPSPSPDPLLPIYRSKLKEDVCAYLYDLAIHLKPLWYPDEPIRENLLFASEAVSCWIEGIGDNFLRDALYKPLRGDHGPFPSHGYPYVIHALMSDKRNFPFEIKYDDPTKTGLDLYKMIASRLGIRPEEFTVYRGEHPISFTTRLDSLNLHFQDQVNVDFNVVRYKAGEDGRVIQSNFYQRTGDSQLSLQGIAP